MIEIGSLTTLLRRSGAAILKNGPVNVFHFIRVKAKLHGFRWLVEYLLSDHTRRRALLAGKRHLLQGGAVAVSALDVATIVGLDAGRAPIVGRPGPLEMTKDYSIDSNVWNDFLGPLFIRELHNPASTLKPRVFPKIWFVIAQHSSGTAQLDQTNSAICRLREAADFPIEVIYWGMGEQTDGRVSKANSAPPARLLGAIADEDFVFWLKAGDAPRPELAPALKLHLSDGVEALTFDGYFYDGDRVFPVLHPGVNPEHALNVDYFFSRFLMRAGVVRKLRAERRNLSPIELFRRRIKERRVTGVSKAEWRHVNLPVIHLELSSNEIIKVRDELYEGNKPYVPELSARDVTRSKVSVVICTKDKGNLVRQLVRSCVETAGEIIYEIIIVSNNTTNYFARQTLRDLAKLSSVKIIKYDAPFNFSAQSNLGAKESTGDFILMLNDDVTPITSDWMHRLLEPFADPDVGLSAPLLLYPNESVQHAGMFVGYNSCAGHTLRFAKLPDQDYMFYASAPRRVSCLTGAVLLVSRECFESLNGFDELLSTHLQDVDLCLRAKASGFINMFVPGARLFHMESVSVADHITQPSVMDGRGREHAYFYHRWKHKLSADEFHNSLFDSSSESLTMLAPSPVQSRI